LGYPPEQQRSIPSAGTNEEKNCLRIRPAQGGELSDFDIDPDFDFDAITCHWD